MAKGNETVEYALSLPQLAQGNNLEVSRGITCHDFKKPLGVCVSIVPFSTIFSYNNSYNLQDFPFMVPFWTIAIAIAMGNTVVIKPSEKVPLTMSRVMSILKEAGLPNGVINLVNGDASSNHTHSLLTRFIYHL